MTCDVGYVDLSWESSGAQKTLRKRRLLGDFLLLVVSIVISVLLIFGYFGMFLLLDNWWRKMKGRWFEYSRFLHPLSGSMKTLQAVLKFFFFFLIFYAFFLTPFFFSISMRKFRTKTQLLIRYRLFSSAFFSVASIFNEANIGKNW